MTVADWLASARRDAESRGLDAVKPLLDTLAQATIRLRQAADERLPSAGADRPSDDA